MVLAQQAAAKERDLRRGGRACTSARPRLRGCRSENARLGFARNFRRVAPGPKRWKCAEGFREMPSFTVKSWWVDHLSQGGQQGDSGGSGRENGGGMLRNRDGRPVIFAANEGSPDGGVPDVPAAMVDDGAPSLSVDEIRKAYSDAYEKWWQNRPKQFRTWGPLSNLSGGPACESYALFAADAMRAEVNIPGTGAYAVWNTESPTSTLGKFVETKPNSWWVHSDVRVYATTPSGQPFEIAKFDPWRRLW
jgi:hypothetical protein